MDYNSLSRILKTFQKLKKQNIGRSEDDRIVYALSAFFDAKKPWIIVQGAIHAREHLSADFVIALAFVVEHNFEKFKTDANFPNICFVPMVNPDGVEIVHFGSKAIKNKTNQKLVKKILEGNNHRLYKSNARGVDLNNNFDALWGKREGKSVPSMQGYPGTHAFSERESRVLRDLTLQLLPIFTLSYHMKGEEVYWDFFQQDKFRERDKKIAQIVASVNGYQIKSTQDSSSGGYKDWCVKCLEIPSLTIELGRDEFDHPMQNAEIYDIIAKNIGILDRLCDIVELIKGEKG